MKFQDRHTFQFRNLPTATVLGQNAFNVRMPPRCPDVIYITQSRLAAQFWTNPTATRTNFPQRSSIAAAATRRQPASQPISAPATLI